MDGLAKCIAQRLCSSPVRVEEGSLQHAIRGKLHRKHGVANKARAEPLEPPGRRAAAMHRKSMHG